MDVCYEIEKIGNDWTPILREIVQPYAPKIEAFLKEQKTAFDGVADVFPPTDLVFHAFRCCSFADLSVILLGQDPYIKKGEAQGLCFSVPEGTKIPPSLRNVFKEIELEYGEKRVRTDLTDWATQNVLLLNRYLTVREGKSLSHMNVWKELTMDVLRYIIRHKRNIVYILWGNNAQEIVPLINASQNLVLCSVHPSPLAQTRGNSFLGNGHFKRCNEYLVAHGKRAIVWV